MPHTSDCPENLNSGDIESRFPDGSEPLIPDDGHGSLCSIGHSPLGMTGLLRHIVIQHFGDTRNILDNDLRKWFETKGAQQYRATGTNGPLYIESLDRWDPAKAEADPGVIIKSHDWQWQSMGINDHLESDTRTGTKKYGGYWVGAHTLFTSSTQPGVAQTLGLELAKLFLWFRPVIQKSFRLERFVLVKLGAVATMKQAVQKTFTTPITVAYAAGETWSLHEDAPRLKRLGLNFGHP